MSCNDHIVWDQESNSWLVWDEAALELGKYETRDEAEQAFKEYCDYLFGEHN